MKTAPPNNPLAIDPHFAPDELLYRRVQPIHWGEDGLELDALNLPDMSVNRGKYSAPEDLVASTTGRFDGWAVCAFQVQDIPPSLIDQGVFTYEFRVEHNPEPGNRAHSEVRAYENGVHMGTESFQQRVSTELHLRFRVQLHKKARIVLRVPSH